MPSESSYDHDSNIFASTPRLHIRAPTEADLERLSTLWATHANQRTDPAGVVPWGPARVKKVQDELRDIHFLGILESREPHPDVDDTAKSEATNSEEARFVGAVMFADRYASKNRDIMFGISLARRWWGRGLGKEATVWMINHAFEQLNMHRVTLHVMGDNERAIRLYKSIGFVEEGRRRKAVWQDGRWTDDVNMGILHEDWEEHKRNQPQT